MTIETKEALLNGASMFIEPMTKEESEWYKKYEGKVDANKLSISCIGYQIKQQVTIDSKEIGTIKSVKIIKVQDININDMWETAKFKDNFWTSRCFKNWYNKQYNNYDQNPYVFLYEVAK